MSDEKIRYKCLGCSYKFSRAGESKYQVICPNCGKTNVTRDQRNEADSLLKDASSKQFDF